MSVANRNWIADRRADDFSAHPVPAFEVIEVLGVMGRASDVPRHPEKTRLGAEPAERRNRQHRALEPSVRPVRGGDN